MYTFAATAPAIFYNSRFIQFHGNRNRALSFSAAKASLSINNHTSSRRQAVTALITTALVQGILPPALAENWGSHSFLKERYFMPDLSPEDSAARIRQTAEGLHGMRDMLENMSWRYVLFYIRLKNAYLNKDLKIALSTLPSSRQEEYVKVANELVDNMSLLDFYVRTPKVYESYLYYEKSLKNLDDIVSMLA